MVGIRRYTDEQVFFILDRHVMGLGRREIADDFRRRFGVREYSPSQVQYVVEYYGRDPRFG